MCCLFRWLHEALCVPVLLSSVFPRHPSSRRRCGIVFGREDVSLFQSRGPRISHPDLLETMKPYLVQPVR